MPRQEPRDSTREASDAVYREPRGNAERYVPAGEPTYEKSERAVRSSTYDKVYDGDAAYEKGYGGSGGRGAAEVYEKGYGSSRGEVVYEKGYVSERGGKVYDEAAYDSRYDRGAEVYEKAYAGRGGGYAEERVAYVEKPARGAEVYDKDGYLVERRSGSSRAAAVAYVDDYAGGERGFASSLTCLWLLSSSMSVQSLSRLDVSSVAHLLLQGIDTNGTRRGSATWHQQPSAEVWREMFCCALQEVWG